MASQSPTADPALPTTNKQTTSVENPALDQSASDPVPFTTPCSLEKTERNEDDDDHLDVLENGIASQSDGGDDESAFQSVGGDDESGSDSSSEDSSDGSEPESEYRTTKEEIAALFRDQLLPLSALVPPGVAATLTGTLGTERNDEDSEAVTPEDDDENEDDSEEKDDSKEKNDATEETKPADVPGWAQYWGGHDFVPAISSPISLYNDLLIKEVFKVHDMDHDCHVCRGVDAQGAPCKERASGFRSFGPFCMRLFQHSVDYGREFAGYKALAKCCMCSEHEAQSLALEEEWGRLAALTKPARQYWQKQYDSYPWTFKTLRATYWAFATAEVQRILAQDAITVRAEKEKADLYSKSQETIESLREEMQDMERSTSPVQMSKICQTQTEELTPPRSLHDDVHGAPVVPKIDFSSAKKQYEKEIQDAKSLNAKYQTTIKNQRTHIVGLNAEIKKLTTVNAILDEHRATALKLCEETGSIQETPQNTTNVHETHKAAVAQLNKTITDLRSEVKDLKIKNAALETQQPPAPTTTTTTDPTLTLSTLSTELNETTHKYLTTQTLLTSTQSKLTALQSQHSTLQSTLTTLQSKTSALETALAEEKLNAHTLGVRLEERTEFRLQDTRLEAYLRAELEQARQRIAQQQQAMKELRDDHTELRIANAVLGKGVGERGRGRWVDVEEVVVVEEGGVRL